MSKWTEDTKARLGAWSANPGRAAFPLTEDCAAALARIEELEQRLVRLQDLHRGEHLRAEELERERDMCRHGDVSPHMRHLGREVERLKGLFVSTAESRDAWIKQCDLAEKRAEAAEAEARKWQECSARQDHELDAAGARAEAAEAKLAERDFFALEEHKAITDLQAKLAEAQRQWHFWQGQSEDRERWLKEREAELAAEREAHEKTLKDLRATGIAHEFESGCAKRFLAERDAERERVRKLREALEGVLCLVDHSHFAQDPKLQLAKVAVKHEICGDSRGPDPLCGGCTSDGVRNAALRDEPEEPKHDATCACVACMGPSPAEEPEPIKIDPIEPENDGGSYRG